MTKCEHSSSTIQADHGNVQLSECDWECGAILISVEKNGITRTLTANEAWELKAENTALYRRISEMEYALDAGNIAKKPVSTDVLSKWFRYVITGQKEAKK